ncbi:MAG: aspartate-semialdehyde dehydrogenase [Clostridia bacterium]|nr:aspartate-semialdehyde dehydrogenase [Clostridia bacterium]
MDNKPVNLSRKVAVVGATGMVGQRFVSLLANHPWFQITALAASPRSAGKPYAEAVGSRWAFDWPIPEKIVGMPVVDASEIDQVAQQADFVFCAVDMPKEDTRKLEDAYARRETPVISNNSAHRMTADVPMVIPEINPEHAEVIEAQRLRLGTRTGFVAVKPNCSIQSYVPPLHALRVFRPLRMAVSTYQSISGAGKTFATWPEMVDNVIPYIGGEEEKSEREPLKIWGKVRDGQIELASEPVISAHCVRVAVADGHMATVSVAFAQKPSPEQILEAWRNYTALPQQLSLPSAPKSFLHYFDEPNRPQTRLDRDLEQGMAIALGRLREDRLFDYRFVGLSHNTLRGAAGGGVLIAELLCAQGYVPRK